jgi:hypothetical protein
MTAQQSQRPRGFRNAKKLLVLALIPAAALLGAMPALLRPFQAR